MVKCARIPVLAHEDIIAVKGCHFAILGFAAPGFKDSLHVYAALRHL